MLGNRTWDEWIAQYSASHRHAVNRAGHTLGVSMIALSGLFLTGRVLQFIGHAFEGKPPEFFKDWRFLFVGLRWWSAKLRGQASFP